MKGPSIPLPEKISQVHILQYVGGISVQYNVHFSNRSLCYINESHPASKVLVRRDIVVIPKLHTQFVVVSTVKNPESVLLMYCRTTSLKICNSTKIRIFDRNDARWTMPFFIAYESVADTLSPFWIKFWIHLLRNKNRKQSQGSGQEGPGGVRNSDQKVSIRPRIFLVVSRVLAGAGNVAVVSLQVELDKGILQAARWKPATSLWRGGAVKIRNSPLQLPKVFRSGRSEARLFPFKLGFLDSQQDYIPICEYSCAMAARARIFSTHTRPDAFQHVDTSDTQSRDSGWAPTVGSAPIIPLHVAGPFRSLMSADIPR